jgi:acetyltransferase-like isoleucine patch superfamily enzyme
MVGFNLCWKVVYLQKGVHTLIRKIISCFRKSYQPHPNTNLRKGENSTLSGSIDMRSLNSYIEIGDDCLIEGTLVTETDGSRIKIGNNVYIGGGTLLDCVISIQIEDDVLIAYQNILADSDNHNVDYEIRKKDLADWRNGGKHDWITTNSAPIKISKGAWIGARCIILKGVTIGEGAVIGAGSVVTKDVPDWTMVAGNPARIVKRLKKY